MASSGTIREVTAVQRIAVEDLPAHLATLEAELSGGRGIELVRGGVVVAEVRGVEAVSEAEDKAMPDFKARLRDIWGETPLDVDMTTVIREDRDARGAHEGFARHVPQLRAQMKAIFGDEVLDVDTAEWVAEGRDRDLLL